MARVNLQKDQELAKQNLLRISVIADLLGVAPKTVNIWLGEYHTKVRGVKYLNWTLVRAQRPDDFAALGLPSDGPTAHATWALKQTGHYDVYAGHGLQPVPAFKPDHHVATAALAFAGPPTGTVEAAAHAIDKAKALLHKSSVVVAEQDHTTIEGFDVPLEVPKIEEPVLTVPQEFKKKNASIATKNLAINACDECAHSLYFHSLAGCSFARGTVAACKCKKGI